MIEKMNGQQYYDLIDYGTRNLYVYKERVNALNVFPVPDGDTGTNMLVTLQTGLTAMEQSEKQLSELSRKFARAITFGARGNSGVILSQFFKGMSEVFYDVDEADYHQFSVALENGVKCAYKAVPNPVEGTILTVLRESAEFVRTQLEVGNIASIDDVIGVFLTRAKTSLDSTPELLSVLKSAGVVDSGGAGIIYVFEGMHKYLLQEALPEPLPIAQQKVEDYSRFNRDSVFEFGYCTEFLLQLTSNKQPFDYSRFCEDIADLGDSLVTVQENDKVKVHIHSATPERVLAYCHQYGEFLSLKIENMSVQHQEIYTESKEEPTEYGEGNLYSVVAVAHNESMKTRFLEMGADYVITADYKHPPTASDFLDAFALSATHNILVFPNNKNSELAAIQAQRLCEDAAVYVAGTRSDAQCYAALPMLDFDCEDVSSVVEQVQNVVDNLDVVLLTQAKKETCFDGKPVMVGDYISTIEHDLQVVGGTLLEVALATIDNMLANKECDVITMFVSQAVTGEDQEKICNYVSANFRYTEITVIETDDDFYRIVFSFE